WRVMGGRFSLGGESYADIFLVCVALTNLLVTRSPLRRDEAATYRHLMRKHWYSLPNRRVEEDEEEDEEGQDAPAEHSPNLSLLSQSAVLTSDSRPTEEEDD
ncbi:hypothetical protein ADUPG1_009045, partial [Aduncisulcus paluster]